MSTTTTAPEPAQHTPGPWFVGDGNHWGSVFGADGFEVCDTAQGPHTHTSFDGSEHWAGAEGRLHKDRSEDEEFANANLIAAAPDLLAAAEEFFSLRDMILECVDQYWGAGADYDAVETALDAVDAAIAKAEGRAA